MTDDHDLGLSHDLSRILQRERAWGRRRVLGLVGGIGATVVAGCGGDDASSSRTSSSSAAGTTSGQPSTSAPAGGSPIDVSAGEIPEETAGPFPGNGSNGPNVLAESGVERRDLTRSIGSASGVAAGVPMTVRMRVFDLAGEEVAPFAGAAVYLWHCDREGRYSLYSEGVADENYLRGVQAAGADGRLEFTTIFPGCYGGRWPHMHFEVYESLAAASRAEGRLTTSQLALPQDACATVYGEAEGYGQSVANLASLSLDSDMVFADGHSLQLAKVTGSIDEGYTATLNVPV